MIDLNTSWKDNGFIFKKQLELNIQQLSSKHNYPQHWIDLLSIIHLYFVKSNSFLDIGCGCGACYALLKKEHPLLYYSGIDYSYDAIELAKKQWEYNHFYTQDFWLLKKDYIQAFDICHVGALFDVMTNGDDALEFLLELSPKSLIISRINFTDMPSYFESYLAYDLIPSSKYFHNKNKFLNICKKYKYNISKHNTNIILNKIIDL